MNEIEAVAANKPIEDAIHQHNTEQGHRDEGAAKAEVSFETISPRLRSCELQEMP